MTQIADGLTIMQALERVGGRRVVWAGDLIRRYFSALAAVAGDSPEHPDAAIHILRR